MSETVYKLNDLYVSIQGEGVKAGTPMVIIRLQGCCVGCSFCDTKETWASSFIDRVETIGEAVGTKIAWTRATGSEIAEKARALAPGMRWALVTGGEPAEQPLKDLVDALHLKCFYVALETSGTALGHVDAAFNWVCVSPKFGQPGGLKVLREACARADEFKVVIGKPADLAFFDVAYMDIKPVLPPVISLQPMSQSKAATELCVRTCIERDWQLSIQQHKYIGVA